jgi:sucrase/ferredoxin-like protein
VVLIRQPDRRPNGLNVFLAHTGGSRTRPLLFHGVVDDPASLLEFDLPALTAGRPVGFGSAIEGPLFLVCTNGRHDVCCAERGRLLYRALTEEFKQTWECSHIGGDRFAGNLVCFPHGMYFGWVDPEDAPGIARRYEQGAIDLDHYRGRASWSTDVQAAEHFVRSERGMTGIDDLVPQSRTVQGEDRIEVHFQIKGGADHAVVVRRVTAPEPAFLTCQAPEPVAPVHYELVSLDPA